MNQEIINSLKTLPNKPGVYIMRGANDKIIYIGKAKNLKKRVSSYFNNASHNLKTATMVSNVVFFEYIIAETELEAFILENNLIKQHRPKYNILLKDDKGYPYIKLTNEAFPRLIFARKRYDDAHVYFGPYLNSKIVRETILLLKKIFQIRDCNRKLPKDIGKERPCLNHHIKQCSAPCDDKIKADEYKENIINAKEFLTGKYENIKKDLQEKMHFFADHKKFELAAKYRDFLITIDAISQKQKIVSNNFNNKDIIAIEKSGKLACVTILFYRNGQMIGKTSHFYNDALDELNEIAKRFLQEYYEMTDEIPSQILINHEPDDKTLIERWLKNKTNAKIEIITPKRGASSDIMRIAIENSLEELNLKLLKNNIYKKKADKLLFDVQKTLSLVDLPYNIECIDISNINGADNIGVIIAIGNGVFKKSRYKKFNIKELENYNPDDYSSIKEVLRRRLLRGLSGDEHFLPMPNLILLDGGKGHLSAGMEILNELELEIPTFGLVKNEKHKTRGVVGVDGEIYLSPASSSFKFFARIQDEVHKYAISSFHTKHKKTTFNSKLESIDGIGKKKAEMLLKHFGSIKKIKNAKLEELTKLRGITTELAEKILSELK
ncbi:excinuclease ABC subunit UvrC [Treponema sp. R6D11]